MICARTLEEARDKLKQLKDKGVEIDEVHIFDHGLEGGQEIGDAYITPRLPGNKKTLGEIGELIEPDGTIILEGCRVAGPSPGFNNGPDYVQDIADASGRTTEGHTGRTYYWPFPNPFGKDHWNAGDKVVKRPQPRHEKKP